MLIGICGCKGSGKDTFGEYVCRSKDKYLSYAFADPLKRVCIELFDLSERQVYHPVAKEVVDVRWGCTPRHIMQVVGTEICRNVLPIHIMGMNTSEGTFWVRKFHNWYRKLQGTDTNVVVTDVRFLDEVEAIKNLGGIVVKIVREGTNYDKHASEVEVSRIVADHTLTNNGTISDFYNDIDELFCGI